MYEDNDNPNEESVIDPPGAEGGGGASLSAVEESGAIDPPGAEGIIDPPGAEG